MPLFVMASGSILPLQFCTLWKNTLYFKSSHWTPNGSKPMMNQCQLQNKVTWSYSQLMTQQHLLANVLSRSAMKSSNSFVSPSLAVWEFTVHVHRHYIDIKANKPETDWKLFLLTFRRCSQRTFWWRGENCGRVEFLITTAETVSV